MAEEEGRKKSVHDGEEEDESKGEEEDTGAQIAPIVKLAEVSVTTGEEDEQPLLDMKSKLYRFHNNEWKERGVGQVRLLKHKDTGKIRLLMRQSKTLKICANHLVSPGITLQEHAGNDKSWIWHAQDFSDGELKNELFCIRLANTESAQKFKEVFEEAQKSTQSNTEETDKAANSAAELLKGLKVEEEKEEDKVKKGDVEKKE